MSIIKIEHDGYEIAFYEHNEEWTCTALSMSSPSLARLKERISKNLAEARRVDAVPVVHVSPYGNSAGERVTATMLDADGKKVWCMVPQGGNAPPARRLYDMDDLALDTPETREAIAKVKALRADADRFRKTAEAILAGLPKVTREALGKTEVETPEPNDGKRRGKRGWR